MVDQIACRSIGRPNWSTNSGLVDQIGRPATKLVNQIGRQSTKAVDQKRLVDQIGRPTRGGQPIGRPKGIGRPNFGRPRLGCPGQANWSTNSIWSTKLLVAGQPNWSTTKLGGNQIGQPIGRPICRPIGCPIWLPPNWSTNHRNWKYTAHPLGVWYGPI